MCGIGWFLRGRMKVVGLIWVLAALFAVVGCGGDVGPTVDVGATVEAGVRGTRVEQKVNRAKALNSLSERGLDTVFADDVALNRESLVGEIAVDLVGFGAGRLWSNVPDRHFRARSGKATGDLAANGTTGTGRYGLFAVKVKGSQGDASPFAKSVTEP